MKTKQVGFRIENKDAEILRRLAIARGEDVSDFLRRALKREFARLNFLSDYEKRALEMGRKNK